MNPERPLLIVNPVAGPWWKRRDLPDLLASFRRRFPRGRVLDRSLQENGFPEISFDPDLLIVKGGDGSVHRIIQDLYPSSLPILVLPGGTGNVLSGFLRVPAEPEQVWSRLPESRICRIRPGYVGPRRFLIMAGIGWDGAAASRVRGKWLLGPAAYYMAGFRTLLSPNLPRFRVRVESDGGEGKSFEDVLWCLVSRLSPYIGPFSVKTREDPDRDSLTVTVISGTRLGIPLAFLSFLPGGSTLLPLSQCRATRIELLPPSSPADDSVGTHPRIQADGETVPFFPVIGVSRDPLSFLSFP